MTRLGDILGESGVNRVFDVQKDMPYGAGDVDPDASRDAEQARKLNRQQNEDAFADAEERLVKGLRVYFQRVW